MGEDTRTAISSWQAGQTLDISDAMHSLLMRVAARTFFSAGMGEQAIDDARRCLRIVSQGIYKRTVAPLGVMEKLPTPSNRRYNEANGRLRHIVDEIIIEHRKSGTDHGDLLSTLLRTRDDETGQGLDDREIHDQVINFLVAGSETTASTLAFAFHLLGTHPPIEKRLHAEIDSTLGGRPPVFEDLPNLAYIQHVVTEPQMHR